MPWINDVAPYSTILSTWGNNIRDHAPAIFTTIAERDTNASKMTEGQLAYCVTEKSLFVRRPSAANGFSTLSEPWKVYTPSYQLDNAFPPSMTNYIADWRRINGTTVECMNTFVINSNYSGGGTKALIWSLPVPCTKADVVIGNGEAYESQKYCIGPVKTYTDASWCYVTDQATRGIFAPVSGSPTVRSIVHYPVADG